MTLRIDLSPELERRLQREAARAGQAPGQYARAVLERALPHEDADEGLYAGLPRRSPEELSALARQQGAPIAVRFEDLLGDFWPEGESADEFMTTLREWRREGRRAPRK